MESLLTSLTNASIKDIERNDFRAETYLNAASYRTTVKANDYNDVDGDDSSLEEEEEEEEEEDDSSDYSQHYNSSDKDINTMDEALANLSVNDYDGIKYTGHSAGLQLLDEKLFKSKTYLPLPGREDVALQLMSENELLVVRTANGKKTDTRLDVGFSLSSTIFDDWHLTSSSANNLSLKSALGNKELPSQSLIEKAIKL